MTTPSEHLFEGVITNALQSYRKKKSSQCKQVIPSQVLVQQDYDCKMIWAAASLVVYIQLVSNNHCLFNLFTTMVATLVCHQANYLHVCHQSNHSACG